jgi:alkylglycerol monooxygenase
MSKVIIFATPVFLLLIALELAWGIRKGRNTYRLSDALNSIGLGMMSQFTAVFTRLLRVGIYVAIYNQLSLVPIEAAKAFWNAWYGWVLALVFYDLCYYWLHRISHTSAVFWAAHVVHHQSQSYNLSTALRQTSSGAFLGWIFYIPMALAGVPPAVFGMVALVDLLYQFWVHTEHVPKLGWFDRWFCSPSNHRVHHAVNDEYVDKNYGGVFVFWDRIFGSYQVENELNPCVYGTRSALNSWDPLWANAQVYSSVLQDAWHTRSWMDKARVFLKPPGWRPADVAQRFPRKDFNISEVQTFAPPISKAVQRFALLSFAVLLCLVLLFLWTADGASPAQHVVGVTALLALLWTIGAVTQSRLRKGEAAMVQAAIIATASAALGLVDVHHIFKPLVLMVALYQIVVYDFLSASPSQFYFRSGDRTVHVTGKNMLLTALSFCLLGDALLMFDGLFVFGLAAFLVGHLCYIALFRGDAPWFASRNALTATLACGVGMFVFLWPHLPKMLLLPVAAYVLAIALMVAQAIGRAAFLRDRASRFVAIGAVFFMLSDTLLAINKFVAPLPVSALLVLGTYYIAQILIVLYALRSGDTSSR